MEDDVVEDEDPGPREGEGVDRLVVAVVPHLVEGEARGVAGRLRIPLQLLHLDRGIAGGEGRIDRLAGEEDEPEIGWLVERRQRRQEVGDVVGDPGADGRERRDEVQAEGRAQDGISPVAPGVPIWPRSQASMKGSRLPSRTRSASPTSAPVRWSLTIR